MAEDMIKLRILRSEVYPGSSKQTLHAHREDAGGIAVIQTPVKRHRIHQKLQEAGIGSSSEKL